MTQLRKRALGRGLEALLPSVDPAEPGQVASVDVDRIEPNPHQPRREWDEADLRSLSDSIRRANCSPSSTIAEETLSISPGSCV